MCNHPNFEIHAEEHTSAIATKRNFALFHPEGYLMWFSCILSEYRINYNMMFNLFSFK
jgi:hypothetical protein